MEDFLWIAQILKLILSKPQKWKSMIAIGAPLTKIIKIMLFSGSWMKRDKVIKTQLYSILFYFFLSNASALNWQVFNTKEQ